MENDAVAGFAFLLFAEDERRNRMRITRRQLRDAHNPYEMPEINFMTLFRLPKGMAHALTENISMHAPVSGNTLGIPFYVKVLATLNFLGTGSYQTPVGCSCWHNLSQSIISRALNEVTTLINNHVMPIKIRFPDTEESKSSVKLGFYNKWGMRGIVGAIDGTHVEIIAPSGTDINHPPFTYINRKGRHSINVMLVCDSNNKILAADARYPGSVHDAAIWQMSDVKGHLQTIYENGIRNCYLIGDSGYPAEPWLLTPCPQYEQGSPEERYNTAHKSARNVIERTNGILKTRFRCLLQHRVLHYHPAKAAQIDYSCATLHNMCTDARLEFTLEPEMDMEIDPAQDNEHEVQDGRQGRQARNLYITNNFNV